MSTTQFDRLMLALLAIGLLCGPLSRSWKILAIGLLVGDCLGAVFWP